ncbi:MAG: type II toxin-antitoxin system RelE/ParE family toxin [Epsilonproteobacteria bacterium]|nr:type II toxin-antitoxin system RelE/ParE family toxin [Campylobacterota bacterium]
MEIVRGEKYRESLKSIMETISKDSVNRAIDFKNTLDKKIDDLDFMPYKFKQSIYFNNENIRDLIFKGYTIPYKIDKEKNQIIIIGINKYKRNL